MSALPKQTIKVWSTKYPQEQPDIIENVVEIRELDNGFIMLATGTDSEEISEFRSFRSLEHSFVYEVVLND